MKCGGGGFVGGKKWKLSKCRIEVLVLALAPGRFFFLGGGTQEIGE